MAISSVSSLANPQPINTSNAEDNTKVGREDFMKLLVTQLQNQDPLEPMDNREMITQLSQLTGVEQLVSIQQRIGALEIATAGMANTQVAQLVGKEITADVGSIRLDASGPGETVYELPSRAHEVSVTIRDANGDVVRTIELGDTFPGQHVLEWDGLDESGQRMNPGRYTIDVNAKDDLGNPIEASTKITGRATGVTYESGYPELRVGEARIMLGDVISISE